VLDEASAPHHPAPAKAGHGAAPAHAPTHAPAQAPAHTPAPAVPAPAPAHPPAHAPTASHGPTAHTIPVSASVGLRPALSPGATLPLDMAPVDAVPLAMEERAAPLDSRPSRGVSRGHG
jgi:hypothetical protein